MNILVIGNGFDLAHDLPTSYIDFLKWIVGQYNFFYFLKMQDAQLTKPIEDISLIMPETIKGIEIFQRVDHQEEIWNCIDDNFWIEYFMPIFANRKRNEKDGWIDFECEISKVIQSLDDDMHESNQIYNIEDIVNNLSNDFLDEMYLDYIDVVQSINPVDNDCSEGISFKEIRDKLLSDLNRLVRVLEIYLIEYVGNIKVQKKSPNISELKIDKVLSFNYTDTFSKLYNVTTGTEDDGDSFDYIHGKADISNTIETNNMVLGIDEYLPDDRKDKDIDFIAFKKFYQRIYKQTGCKYKKWIQNIQRKYSIALQNEANYMVHSSLQRNPCFALAV